MRALLLGFYGQENLGDDLMLFCLERWLARQNIGVTVLSERPGFVELPAVENVPLLGQWAWRDAWFRGKAQRLIRAIRENDALIVGGGDLIREDRGRKLLLYTLEKMFVASALGKRVFLLNAGIGRPATRTGAWLLGQALRRCERIVVRDERSVEVCRALGANATYAPDIVTALPQFLQAAAGAPAGRPYLVAALRSDPNTFGLYDLNEGRIASLAAALDALVARRDADIVCLPFHNDEQGGDNVIHEKIVARMSQGGRAVIRPWTPNLARVVECISGARCVLAMRLHAAVAAAAFGRPYVLMPYDHKLVEFAKQQRAAKIRAADLDDGGAAAAAVLEGALTSPRGPATPPLDFWISGELVNAAGPGGPART